MDSLGNIVRLGIDGDHNLGVFVIESFGDIVISDFFDGLSDDLFVDDVGVGGDFSEDHAQVVFDGGFAGNH